MRDNIYIYDGIKNIDKTRKFAAEIDVWDEDPDWEDMAWIRSDIKEKFAEYDPVVVREFKASYDAMEFSTFIEFEGKTIRLDYCVELKDDNKSYLPKPKYPHSWCAAAYKRLLEDEGLIKREGYHEVGDFYVTHECGERAWDHRPDHHDHLMLPKDYDWRKYPNFAGWSAYCTGTGFDSEGFKAACERVRGYANKDHGYREPGTGGLGCHFYPRTQGEVIVDGSWLSGPLA